MGGEGDPPLQFINTQPQRGDPPLEFTNTQSQKGTTSRIHQHQPPKMGSTSRIYQHTAPQTGAASRIHQNTDPQKGSASRIHHSNGIHLYISTTKRGTASMDLAIQDFWILIMHREVSDGRWQKTTSLTVLPVLISSCILPWKWLATNEGLSLNSLSNGYMEYRSQFFRAGP